MTHRHGRYYARILPPILAGAPPSHPSPQEIASALTSASTLATAATTSPSTPAAAAAATVEVAHTPACPSSEDATAVTWTDARTLSVGGRADWGGLPRENWYVRAANPLIHWRVQWWGPLHSLPPPDGARTHHFTVEAAAWLTV